jgi:aubergine-like protein
MAQETEYRGPRQNFIKEINNKFKDAILITKYNNLTYKFVEMDFSVNPKSTFPGKKGVLVSYLDYYKKYDCKIEDLDQPLILATPTKKPPNFKNSENGAVVPVVLIPELCNFTGLTDQMRQNNSLMRTLSESLHMAPIPRIKRINEFMANLMAKQEVKTRY